MTDAKSTKTCGLVMPLSTIDGCSAEHWSEVKAIITDAVSAISSISFSVRLVSDADDVGVIQKRIVQNLYTSDIVVCDVSGKNPNVMFELGMRLAFDKPTVIVKDDKTEYSFDTGIIEHVPYRRDLRFASVVSFKKHLADKVAATISEAEKNSEHSTFLKNFGTFNVAHLKQSEVSSDKVVIEMLAEVQHELSLLRRRVSRRPERSGGEGRDVIRAALRAWRSENGDCSFEELFGNEIVYDYVEREVDAPKYFSNQSEFRQAVDTELINLTGV